jgi:N-acetylneuraminic acid mutarotase
LDGLIYYIGGLSGWPGPHADTVYIYDPETDSFSEGASMPRGRGAGGVAVHDGKIYYAGGMHDGKAVSWFDVYDPKTNSWSQLPDMPRARDHFQAAVVGGKLYAIGGRDSGVSIDATTPKVEVYDLTKGAAGAWQTPNTGLPTQRGGFAAAVLGQEILVIGGEGGGKAHNAVEAYNTATNAWRTLEPMPTARHGTQAVVCNGGVYVAAGGMLQGGGGATNKHEVFFLGAPTACETPPGETPPKDTTPPDTGITSGPYGRVAASFATFRFSSTEAGSSFECRLDGGSFGPCSSPKSYGGLANGTHTFQVRARDAAGNVDPTPAGRSWIVDTTKPTISRLSPAPDARVRDRTPTIRALVRDNTELTRSDIRLFVDGRGKRFSYDQGTDRLSHTSRRLSYGWHKVRIVATDKAGNRTVETWSFRVVR